MSFQPYVEVEVVLYGQQGLRVAFGVVHGVVRVLGLAQVLETLMHVLDDPLVEGPQVGGAEAEWILASKMVEVPVDELPIEAVVVGYEHRLPLGSLQP